jgi:hypothetical protein
MCSIVLPNRTVPEPDADAATAAAALVALTSASTATASRHFIGHPFDRIRPSLVCRPGEVKRARRR